AQFPLACTLDLTNRRQGGSESECAILRPQDRQREAMDKAALLHSPVRDASARKRWARSTLIEKSREFSQDNRELKFPVTGRSSDPLGVVHRSLCGVPRAKRFRNKRIPT